jgi:hypothetical protein
MLRRTILAGELSMPLAGENELSAISKDPQALVRVPIGAASPLWGLFAGAAVSGAAWWWMTRWARPANLEALFGAAETATAEVEALATPAVEAVQEAPAVVEPVVEAAVETVEAAPDIIASAIESTAERVEAAAEQVLPAAEDLIEAAPKAVGGESAPISPVLEALSSEVVTPSVEPTPPAETALETAAEVAPEPAPFPKPKKPAVPKAD